MKYNIGDKLLIVKEDEQTPHYTPVGEYFLVEDITQNFYMNIEANIICAEEEVVGPEIYNSKLFKAIK